MSSQHGFIQKEKWHVIVPYMSHAMGSSHFVSLSFCTVFVATSLLLYGSSKYPTGD